MNEEEVPGTGPGPSAGAPGPTPTGTSAGKVDEARILAAIDTIVRPFAAGRKLTVARTDARLVEAVRRFLASGRDETVLVECLNGVGKIRSNAAGLIATHVGRAADEPVNDVERSMMAEGVERGRLVVEVDRLRGERDGIGPYLVAVDELVDQGADLDAIRDAIDDAVDGWETNGPASCDALERRLDALWAAGTRPEFSERLRNFLGNSREADGGWLPDGPGSARHNMTFAERITQAESDLVEAGPVVDVRAEADALVEQLRAMKGDNPDRFDAITRAAKMADARNLRDANVAESDLAIVRRAMEDHPA